VSSARKRRASREEQERRLAEVTELLVARTAPSQVVRFAVKKWDVGARAAQKYVAEAQRRLRERSEVDLACELGKALCGYEMIFRRQLAAGDLRSARATLDRLVRLLGLAVPKKLVITTAMLDEEIARLEAELAGLEAQAP
jgi:hypothetical protein